MNRVLILYPKLFNCYSKFFRKVNKIISHLGDVTLVFPSDPNNFIANFIGQNQSAIGSDELPEWSESNITHAIIFDDGEEFPKELERIKSTETPCRFIKINITRVINIKNEDTYKFIKSSSNYEYIGRNSYWGNPHSMYEEGDDREEVIRKYKYDFDYEKFPNKKKSEVFKLAGKRLGCFCKPLPCHGDVLADFLNSWDDGK